jgi:hypothetical protein
MPANLCGDDEIFFRLASIALCRNDIKGRVEFTPSSSSLSAAGRRQRRR